MNASCPAAVFALLLVGVGCATSLTPEGLQAEAPALSGRWMGRVSVGARAPKDPHPRFQAAGTTLDLDLAAFSQRLADLLSQSLREAGLDVGSEGKKIEVEAVFLDFLFQGPCYLDYNVHLGNGESFGLQSSGDSALYTKACRMAMEEAVLLTLDDARTRRYLGER